jgi:hypothetical protein
VAAARRPVQPVWRKFTIPSTATGAKNVWIIKEITVPTGACGIKRHPLNRRLRRGD